MGLARAPAVLSSSVALSVTAPVRSASTWGATRVPPLMVVPPG
ncbi:hypothetical protein [Salmonella enterica]|nr:hypothetical protein [Salmonella enterica]